MLSFDCFAVAQLTTKIKHLSSALHKKVKVGTRSLCITVSTFLSKAQILFLHSFLKTYVVILHMFFNFNPACSSWVGFCRDVMMVAESEDVNKIF